jgi:uncharacterized membrane protein YvlD (DUF360 family)
LKYLQRLVANAMAVYLALYLIDSVAGGRFRVGAVWAAVLLAVALSLVNCPIRPLHRVRTRTARSLIVTLITLIANALVVQVFAWATPLELANLSWVVFVAAAVSLLTGVINWLIGFKIPAKGRAAARSRRS